MHLNNINKTLRNEKKIIISNNPTPTNFGQKHNANTLIQNNQNPE